MRVLIIDDNEEISGTLLRRLRRLPHVKEVCVVRDAESARQMIEAPDDENRGPFSDEPPYVWDMVVMNSVPEHVELATMIGGLPKPYQPRHV